MVEERNGAVADDGAEASRWIPRGRCRSCGRYAWPFSATVETRALSEIARSGAWVHRCEGGLLGGPGLVGVVDLTDFEPCETRGVDEPFLVLTAYPKAVRGRVAREIYEACSGLPGWQRIASVAVRLDSSFRFETETRGQRGELCKRAVFSDLPSAEKVRLLIG